MSADRESRRRAYLYHDIGKLVVRASGDSLDSGHAAASAEFLRKQLHDEDAARIVEAHHRRETADNQHRETVALQAASDLSRREQPPVQTTDEHRGRLHDTFATLGADSDRTYPLEPLQIDEEVMFATDHEQKDTADAYGTLYGGLSRNVGPNSSYERLVSALERYTWCVPTDPEVGAVPLYDHLRTTAALGEALYESDSDTATLERLGEGKDVEEELFTLVKGDISGIQDFIHQMRSPDEAQEGFAKRLRGRSTQLWLLTEGLARLFVDRLDLPPTSLIWSGGGQFYAIVPATADDAVDAFTAEVNEWLFDRYGVDLFFVAGQATVSRSETAFSTLFGRAASDADRQKYQKAGSATGEIDSAVIGPPVEPCRSCGRDNVHGDKRCRECQIQELLGEKMATATHVTLVDGASQNADYVLDLPEGSMSWQLTTDPTTTGRCYRLNSAHLSPDEPVDGFLFTGSTVPHGGAVDRVWSFREIADLGRSSAEYIHVSKLDIDSLGEAITTGMQGGPARLAALSSALDRFFAGYSNALADELSYYRLTEGACDDCRSHLSDTPSRTVDHSAGPGQTGTVVYYRPDQRAQEALHSDCTSTVSPVYIGFAGGDDMFFVGPWDEAVTFGRDVRERFASYTDRTLTLSGGFFLTQPSYPVGRAVEQAEEHLERAKAVEYEGQVKNAVHLFSVTQVWNTRDEKPGAEELIQFGERLESLIQTEELPRSLLYKFTQIREAEYPQQLSPGETSLRKDASWQLKYILARRFDGELLRELEDELPRALPWMDVPVSWASLATR
jgi:CRISPR-associated protein Csm1